MNGIRSHNQFMVVSHRRSEYKSHRLISAESNRLFCSLKDRQLPFNRLARRFQLSTVYIDPSNRMTRGRHVFPSGVRIEFDVQVIDPFVVRDGAFCALVGAQQDAGRADA